MFPASDRKGLRRSVKAEDVWLLARRAAALVEAVRFTCEIQLSDHDHDYAWRCLLYD